MTWNDDRTNATFLNITCTASHKDSRLRWLQSSIVKLTFPNCDSDILMEGAIEDADGFFYKRAKAKTKAKYQ